MRARAGHSPRGMAGARVDGIDKPRLPDGDVNQTGCRVENVTSGGPPIGQTLVTSPEVLLISTRVESSQAT